MEIELPTTKHAGSVEYAKLDISDDTDDPILSSEEENARPHPYRSKWNVFAATVISFATLAIVSGFSILAYSHASRRTRLTSNTTRDEVYYVFAYSWQPYFCYGHSNGSAIYPGCTKGYLANNPDHELFWGNNMTLHGINFFKIDKLRLVFLL